MPGKETTTGSGLCAWSGWCAIIVIQLRLEAKHEQASEDSHLLCPWCRVDSRHRSDLEVRTPRAARILQRATSGRFPSRRRRSSPRNERGEKGGFARWRADVVERLPIAGVDTRIAGVRHKNCLRLHHQFARASRPSGRRSPNPHIQGRYHLPLSSKPTKECFPAPPSASSQWRRALPPIRNA